MRTPKILCTLLALWLGLAPIAGATWSIILVDAATGEVAVGTATCLPGTDLRAFVPVIVVGVGAGATQSQVDPTGKHKKTIFNELQKGTPVPEILELLKAQETVAALKCSRQYGVVDMFGGAQSFSGGCNGPFKSHRFGTVGTVSYAIQGNVLTGLPVILAAQAAVLESEGQLLSDRLMLAMEAARAMGGDGRCSCLTGTAPSCGAPPVAGFEKSAHVGTVVLARVGDTDGPCSGGATGCAAGDYWLNMNFQGLEDDIDPVFWLQDRYEIFKARMRGHVDALQTRKQWSPPVPLSGGGAVAELELNLRDLEGTPITHGGAKITIAHSAESAGNSTRHEIKDHGDGRYTLRFLANAVAGVDRYEITVDDGLRPTLLYPLPELSYPVALATSTDAVSASGGAQVSFEVQAPSDAAGRPFVLGLSLDGPGPGIPLAGGALLPLRRDAVLAALPQLVSAGLLDGVPGTLDAEARATVELTLPPGLLTPLIGQTLRAAWTTDQPTDFASGPVTLRIDP